MKCNFNYSQLTVMFVQVKRDLASGQLHCNDNTAALMASYIVQGNPGSELQYLGKAL